MTPPDVEHQGSGCGVPHYQQILIRGVLSVEDNKQKLERLSTQCNM